MLTYWQSVVKAKHFDTDYNGYALASMYLIAALLIALSRRVSLLNCLTAELVIGTMLIAGISSAQVVMNSQESHLYGWLLVYQSVYHMGNVMNIFQVGSTVSQAVEEDSLRPTEQSGTTVEGYKSTMSLQARLTLLFTTTGLLSSVVENIIQLCISHWRSLEDRLCSLSIILAVVSGLLSCRYIREKPLGKSRGKTCDVSSEGIAADPCCCCHELLSSTSNSDDRV
jgi:hypothetical protein